MTESLPADAAPVPPENTRSFVQVETSLEERMQALRASGGKLAPGLKAFRSWQYWLATALAYVLIGFGVARMRAEPISGALLIGAASVGLILWARRQRYLLLAGAVAKQYQVSADTAGLTIVGQHGESHLSWSGVDSVEFRSDTTLIFLRGYQCLPIPDRCFASEAKRLQFVDQLRSNVAQTSSAPRIDPDQAVEDFVPDLWRNLRAGLLLLGFRASAIPHLRGSVPQLIALFVLALLVGLSGDLVRVGLDGQFSTYALLTALFGVPWLLLAAWAAARIAGDEKAMLRAAVGVQALWCWIGVIGQGMSFLPQGVWQAVGAYAMLLWWLPVAYGMSATLLALIRATHMPSEQRVGALLIVIYLMVLPFAAVPRSQPLWVANEEEPGAASAEQRERWEAPTREAILYSQPRLIDATLNQIKAGTPGKPELFLLALGGHGGQDVFMREVKSVTQLFAERFGTAGHSAVLLNNPTTLNEYPLASVTALDETLQGMAKRMNLDEDVLFLFMTSHGGDDFRFDLSMWPYKFDDLTPQRLKSALDKAGIRHRVVIVSSCYSGGFVPPLADADTWVMTAARADRNSHGCSHEADWTFFGRAFFSEALQQTRSFEQAFDMAKKAIAVREKSEELTPSEPQTGGGEAVKPLLRAITGAASS